MRLLYALPLVTVLLTEVAHANRSRQNLVNIINGQNSTVVSPQQDLHNLQRELTRTYDEVERLMEAQDFSNALVLAKGILDNVRMATGIDPRTGLQESFFVDTTFPNSARSMRDLDERQRNLIIRTIADFRRNSYLDIMNLSKRTTLLYTRAFQKNLEHSGGLSLEDRQKIQRDLVRASLIPIPIVDKNNFKIYAFEEDVASEDHTYMFNRELRTYFVENPALAFNPESFERMRASFRSEVLASLGQRQTSTPQVNKGLTCMQNTNPILDYDDRNRARRGCFSRHYRSTQSIGACTQLAEYILDYDDKNRAMIDCTNRFNN